MAFTGYQDQTRDAHLPPLPMLLAHIDDAADRFGLQIAWPELKKARAIQARADELRAAFADRVAAGRDLTVDRARAYATGKEVSAAAVIEQAATSAALAGEVGREARRIVDHAANNVQAEGAPLLYGIGEDRWLKLIGPVVAERIAVANAVADEIGIDAPRPARPGVKMAAHPWAPTDDELAKSMPLRHRWERLEAALQALDDAYAFADTLRRWRLLPMVEGRTLREDYRWLRVDRLEGSPGHAREFWLAHRHHGEPGIFSADEMRDADEARPSGADAQVERSRVVA